MKGKGRGGEGKGKGRFEGWGSETELSDLRPGHLFMPRISELAHTHTHTHTESQLAAIAPFRFQRGCLADSSSAWMMNCS